MNSFPSVNQMPVPGCLRRIFESCHFLALIVPRSWSISCLLSSTDRNSQSLSKPTTENLVKYKPMTIFFLVVCSACKIVFKVCIPSRISHSADLRRIKSETFLQVAYYSHLFCTQCHRYVRFVPFNLFQKLGRG